MKEIPISQEEVYSLGKTIHHEVNLLYILSMACDAMVFDIEWRLKKANKCFQLKQEAKMRMKQYLELLSKTETHFENFICPSIINSSKEDNFKDFEKSRMYAQELLRLLMLYYEKCQSFENHAKIFDALESLKSNRGAFSVDDINHFNLGCKNE